MIKIEIFSYFTFNSHKTYTSHHLFERLKSIQFLISIMDVECAICQENIETTDKEVFHTGVCIHTFHNTCMAEWKFRSSSQLTCPTCRCVVPKTNARRLNRYQRLGERIKAWMAPVIHVMKCISGIASEMATDFTRSLYSEFDYQYRRLLERMIGEEIVKGIQLITLVLMHATMKIEHAPNENNDMSFPNMLHEFVQNV